MNTSFEQLRAADVYVVRLFAEPGDIYLATIKDGGVLALFMSNLDKVIVELDRDISICKGSGAWTSFRSLVDTQLLKAVTTSHPDALPSTDLVRRVNNATQTLGFHIGVGQVTEHLTRDGTNLGAWALAQRVALEFARGWHVVATSRVLEPVHPLH
jgi:hypothetical protein